MRLGLLCILFIIQHCLPAQIIDAPKLICTNVNSDGNVNLTWELPTVNCGDFIAYEIYSTNDLGSPFELLISINDENSTSYLHDGANANNTTWYYFMESLFDCDSPTPEQSDTLDSNDPVFPAIDFLEVTKDGRTVINWLPSISPETAKYYLFLNDNGFIAIDTVFGRLSTSAIDNIGTPNEEPETYTIAAADACDNAGIFNTNPHTTIYAEEVLSTCPSEIEISYTNYEGWNSVSYLLEYAINDEPAIFIDSTNFSSVFADNNFRDGDSVCYRVISRAPDNRLSSSNYICFEASLANNSRFLSLVNSSATDSNHIALEYWPDVSLKNAASLIIDRLNSLGKGLKVEEQNNLPLTAIMTFTDIDVDANEQAYNYKITIQDACEASIQTVPNGPVYLKNKPLPNFTHKLTWSPLNISNSQITSYDIESFINNDWQTIGSLLPNADLIFSAPSTANIIDQCFRILTHYTVFIPALDTTIARVSYSNTACETPFSVFYAPTAIKADGSRGKFIPTISFFNPSTYRMTIFNRWGQVIFSTAEPSEGWLPMGQQQDVFTYVVQYTTLSNQEITKNGTFLVIN